MTPALPTEPVRTTISGIDLVTIPVSHYAELLDCWRRMALGETMPTAGQTQRRVMIDSRSRLFDDPEVANFLADLTGTMRLGDARQACIDRFGVERSPSRATIGRFWQRRRGAI